MRLYDRIADLPLTIDGENRQRHERETSSGFSRATTTVVLDGAGETGRGEDVTYDADDHDALAEWGSFGLRGEYTFSEFAAALDGIDLFPTGDPERPASRHYRRWAFESAGLDLALRQAETTLADALDREYDPLRFVVSTRLGDPPTADRIDAVLDAHPESEFKLDPTADWTADLIETLAATGAVRICDLKGLYRGTVVDQAPDPALYERVFERFPEAVIEDPAITDTTRPILDANRERLSWDEPITGVESVRNRPFEPRWLNIKPSRFGTAESVLDTIEYGLDHGISMYGGGQFELGVGRSHLHALASLFYPEGPNDIAPGGYNDPVLPDGLPDSPLPPPEAPAGLDW